MGAMADASWLLDRDGDLNKAANGFACIVSIRGTAPNPPEWWVTCGKVGADGSVTDGPFDSEGGATRAGDEWLAAQA